MKISNLILINIQINFSKKKENVLYFINFQIKIFKLEEFLYNFCD